MCRLRNSDFTFLPPFPPSPPQVRWFVLKAFMERHALVRIFYVDNDVMLFADVTGYVDLHLSRTYIALAKRWDGWVGRWVGGPGGGGACCG